MPAIFEVQIGTFPWLKRLIIGYFYHFFYVHIRRILQNRTRSTSGGGAMTAAKISAVRIRTLCEQHLPQKVLLPTLSVVAQHYADVILCMCFYDLLFFPFLLFDGI